MDCVWKGDGSRDIWGYRQDRCHWSGKEVGKTEVASLLERFKSNPGDTRYSMRVELGLLDELAAEMFALVVFVSDGLLRINDTTTPSPAARFFSIARSLPLELQMVLDGHERTLLHYACSGDNRSAVIPLLLAHPGIDVNVRDIYG